MKHLNLYFVLFCICCIANCALRALCLLVIRAWPLWPSGHWAGGRVDTRWHGGDSQRAYPVFSQQRFGVILFFRYHLFTILVPQLTLFWPLSFLMVSIGWVVKTKLYEALKGQNQILSQETLDPFRAFDLTGYYLNRNSCCKYPKMHISKCIQKENPWLGGRHVL